MCERWTVLLLGLAFVLWSGCDAAVDPFLESDRQYTLFGTLDMQQDTQYVRVVPIREALAPEPDGSLQATFTSEDLVTGRVVTWRDSLVTFGDGSQGHVFYAPLRLQTGHTYRIEVRAPDSDVVTWAETTVPANATPRVLPAETQRTAGGGLVSGSQTVVWEGLRREPFRVDLWYRFLPADRTPFRDVLLPYEPQHEAAGGDEWDVRLDLRRDRMTLDSLLEVDETPLIGLGLQVTVLDGEFVPPGGVFDREVQAQPGTLSNVENGFGFVGSVARFSVEWVLSREAAEQLDYRTLEQPFAANPRDMLRRYRRDARAPHAHAGHHSGL